MFQQNKNTFIYYYCFNIIDLNYTMANYFKKY
jgi:hypothetical protein